MFGKRCFFGFLAASVMLFAPLALAQDSAEANRAAMQKRLAGCYGGLGISDEYHFSVLVNKFGPVGSKQKSRECIKYGSWLRVEGGEECDTVMHNFAEKYGRCINQALLRKADPKKYSAAAQ